MIELKLVRWTEINTNFKSDGKLEDRGYCKRRRPQVAMDNDL